MSRANERRNYSRTPVAIEAVVFIPGVNDDISCHVTDVSEKGLCFSLPLEFINRLEEGLSIGFHFSDSILFGNSKETYVVTGKGTVKHIERNPDKLHVGCEAKLDELRKYAMKKDAMTYIPERAIRQKK